ncbi:hypothetical protein BKA63DRAFT_126404 [Paraphoma chrysanthemicola]|nr:hypothetical protein BKA63DRAFT_126404 [Paraphoma chrysanthemicola]
MEGLSLVANGLAVVSVALQLSEVCFKLYLFWEAIEDAPHEIATIKEDLRYLTSVFKRIETAERPLGGCITEGMQHCQMKVADLMSIVEAFHHEFQSASRRKRLRTAFKAAIHGKHVARFRESLNDTKATLTLAIVHECVAQSFLATSFELQPLARKQPRNPSPLLTGQHFKYPLSVPSRDITRRVLTQFEESIPKQELSRITIQELMLRTISQTAVASFAPTSLDILAGDAYLMDECGQLRSKTFVYSTRLRLRVQRQTFSFRTILGHLWVRTTTTEYADEDLGETTKSQTVTSLAFYPRRCLQFLGVRNGLEAITALAGRSWIYNCRVTVTRAVPEDAIIFGLCSAGNTQAVQMLLDKGHASVVDTSPNGWKPLHYAAIAGHVDLCAMLIRQGADKTAFVYEGPTESILSPISLFVSRCTDRSADEKIAMLRLFCDCIDLSSAEGDGWLVHEWLKKAYAVERKPISQNSITWLFHLAGNENYVEFNSRQVWSALQHAIRSVLNHAHFNNILARILDLNIDVHETLSQDHISAMGGWVALRVCGRTLLPMIVNAGAFLQMRGFDWINDELPHHQFLQALPNMYVAWCRAVLDAVEQVEIYMREEMDDCLTQLNMTRATFLKAVSRSTSTSKSFGSSNNRDSVCTSCRCDFTVLGIGLVAPARIAIAECVMTGHDFDCRCRDLTSASLHVERQDHPSYSGSYHEDNSSDDADDDEQYFDADPHASCTMEISKSDVFSDIAKLLYRAQGSVWLGDYTIEEELCASCFLIREHYIGEDGLAADFPPMPRSFESLRAQC